MQCANRTRNPETTVCVCVCVYCVLCTVYVSVCVCTVCVCVCLCTVCLCVCVCVACVRCVLFVCMWLGVHTVLCGNIRSWYTWEMIEYSLKCGSAHLWTTFNCFAGVCGL